MSDPYEVDYVNIGLSQRELHDLMVANVTQRHWDHTTTHNIDRLSRIVDAYYETFGIKRPDGTKNPA